MQGREVRLLAAVAVVVALVFLAFMLAATEVHFVPQVVDLYLVCQYAKAMAEGHPFQYNPGEPPSTGATSLLHTLLLAAAHAAGARGEALVAFAIAAGIAFYVASVLLARRIALAIGRAREGLLAGALVALGGPVVWAYLYGSDTGLFMLLSLWLLDRMLAAWRGADLRGMAAAGSLLALARPEGLPIGLLLGAGFHFGPGRGQGAKKLALAWLPTASGLAVLALNRLLTGQWLGTSVVEKSLFANYGLADGLALVAEYLADVVRGLLLGFYPSQVPVGFARGWASLYFPPLGLLVVLAGLVAAPEPVRAPLRLWAVTLGAVFVLLAPNTFMGVHFNRHLLWALPTLLVLAAFGLGRLATSQAAFRAAAGLWLALGVLSTLRFAALYGEMAGDVYRRDVRTAEWIERSLPRGTAMANVVTSVEYLTGHRNLNLHGVTSPAFFGNRTAEREAGVFEALSRLPAAERPGYLITSVATQEANPTLRELVAGEPLFRSTSFGDEILIYPMRYDFVGRNGRLFLPESLTAVEGLKEVDRLNVCDSRDEAAHGYSFTSRLGSLRLNGTARIAAYPGRPPEVVIDGGRAILGGESFSVRTEPGKDLVVVMRTAAVVNANVLRASGAGSFGLEIPEATIVVEAGGRPAARWSFRPRPGWDEEVLRLPADLVGQGRTRLTLSGRYASFCYWFFQ